ncbi:hypothetical protein D9M71_821170 [compost metagenome]
MLRRCSNETDAGNLGALPPIVLADFAGFDAPFDQRVADAQWRQEQVGLGSQSEHGLVIEVVVVVMRQNNRFDRRQLVDADRRLVEAFRPGPLHW